MKLDWSYNSTSPNLPDLITSLTSRDHWETTNQNSTFAKFLLLLNRKHILSLGLQHLKKVEKRTFKCICRWDGKNKLCGWLHFFSGSYSEFYGPWTKVESQKILVFLNITRTCKLNRQKPKYSYQVLTVYTEDAAKSLQSCPTLCDPIDVSPRGSPVPGILQARTLEWVAISFSNAGKWKVKSLSCVRLLATPWTAAHQAPSSMGFSRQEYWSGLPLPSPTLKIERIKIHFFIF